MLSIVPVEDVIIKDGNRSLQYRYLEKEKTAKFVVVDNDKNIIDENPTDEEIEELSLENLIQEDLGQMPIKKFPGVEKVKKGKWKGLYRIRGCVWDVNEDYPDLFMVSIRDDNNPLLMDPYGMGVDDIIIYLVRGIRGDVKSVRDLCKMMYITVYGYPNEEESIITERIWKERHKNDYVFDAEWVECNEKKIVTNWEDLEDIDRKGISIDRCIADEVDELNNKYNIRTTGSCCGHKASKGDISVKKEYKGQMLDLGYIRCNGDNILDINQSVVSFIPKSKCVCEGEYIFRKDKIIEWPNKDKIEKSMENRVRTCYGCGERRKIVGVLTTFFYQVLENYCEYCYVFVKDDFEEIAARPFSGYKWLKSKDADIIEAQDSDANRNLEEFYEDMGWNNEIKEGDEMTENKHELTPEKDKILKDWISKNGDKLNDVLQETDDFLYDSINSKDWSPGTDLEYVHDVTLFILNKEPEKEHCEIHETENPNMDFSKDQIDVMREKIPKICKEATNWILREIDDLPLSDEQKDDILLRVIKAIETYCEEKVKDAQNERYFY